MSKNSKGFSKKWKSFKKCSLVFSVMDFDSRFGIQFDFSSLNCNSDLMPETEIKSLIDSNDMDKYTFVADF